MKKKTYFITTAVALMLAVMPALAQTTGGTAGGSAGTSAQSSTQTGTTGAAAQGTTSGSINSGTGTFTTGTATTGAAGTGTIGTGTTGAGTVGTGVTTGVTGTGTIGAGTTGTATTGTSAGIGATGTATTDPLNPASRAAPAPLSTMDLAGFDALTRSRWDTNGDGRISAAEWNTSHPRWFGSTTRETPRRFGLWDSNHDGFLDDDELKVVFGTSGIHSLYDLNGNGVIEVNEAARIPR
jgi:hypothetical protein